MIENSCDSFLCQSFENDILLKEDWICRILGSFTIPFYSLKFLFFWGYFYRRQIDRVYILIAFLYDSCCWLWKLYYFIFSNICQNSFFCILYFWQECFGDLNFDLSPVIVLLFLNVWQIQFLGHLNILSVSVWPCIDINSFEKWRSHNWYFPD